MKLEQTFAVRMREAREAAGLSQEALGVLAGIDEATAKVRVNQYENGVHAPPLSMINTLAKVLKKPVAWFVCENDTKELYLALNNLPKSKRSEVIKSLVTIIEDSTQSR